MAAACSKGLNNPPHDNGATGTGGFVTHPDSGRDTSTGGQGGTGGGDASAGAGGVSGAAGGGAGGSGGAIDAGGSGGGSSDAGLPAHCSNNKKDTGETDVDCGRECAPCGTGKTCSTGTDCVSLSCDSTLNTCSAPTCSDKIKNGSETDVDCGGTCKPCISGKLCLKGTDCDSGVCSGTPLRCQAWNCNDGVKNGTETDKDCGGSSCPKCQRGNACNFNSDCLTNVCDATKHCACPIGMITVPLPGGGGGTFCIDQYEVTYAQYKVFYDTNPVPQTAACSWKSNYTPTANWPGNDTTLPVRNVDWCDAYGYCEAVGKRLCGKIGGGAGSYSAFTDASSSQWYDACSAQGVSTYPYGSTFSASTCNGYAGGDAGMTSTLLPTNRISNTCQGGAPDLYDMSGNAAEWTDECDTADAGSPQADDCRVRGGSFKATSADLRCDATRTMPRSADADDVGFRCCLD